MGWKENHCPMMMSTMTFIISYQNGFALGAEWIECGIEIVSCYANGYVLL